MEGGAGAGKKIKRFLKLSLIYPTQTKTHDAAFLFAHIYISGFIGTPPIEWKRLQKVWNTIDVCARKGENSLNFL